MSALRLPVAQAHFTFLNLNPARLLSKWYGESNKYAEAYFTLAYKLAPAIIFIDEIDCLFPSGRVNEHEATSMLKAQFLSLWDGLLSSSAQVGRESRTTAQDQSRTTTQPLRIFCGRGEGYMTVT